MIEKNLDIWSMYGKAPICITTNGCVKVDGRAVAGKGIAKQACSRIPGFARILGSSIGEYGNVVRTIYVPPNGDQNAHVLSFPVKPSEGRCALGSVNVVPHMQKKFKPGERVSGWAMLADIEIIKRSLWELRHWRLAKHVAYLDEIYLPRPGCGAGCLDWETQVKPLCEKYGDWLVCVTL